MEKNLYTQGTKVFFDLGYLKGSGKICGITDNGNPIIGHGYIIELSKPIESYPYTHIKVYNNQIKIDDTTA